MAMFVTVNSEAGLTQQLISAIDADGRVTLVQHQGKTGHNLKKQKKFSVYVMQELSLNVTEIQSTPDLVLRNELFFTPFK